MLGASWSLEKITQGRCVWGPLSLLAATEEAPWPQADMTLSGSRRHITSTAENRRRVL